MKMPISVDVASLSDADLQALDLGEERLLTRDGHPFALLVPTSAAALPGQLKAMRLSAFGQLVEQIRAQAVASGASTLTDEEIQAEIDAVRRQQRSGS